MEYSKGTKVTDGTEVFSVESYNATHDMYTVRNAKGHLLKKDAQDIFEFDPEEYKEYNEEPEHKSVKGFIMVESEEEINKLSGNKMNFKNIIKNPELVFTIIGIIAITFFVIIALQPKPAEKKTEIQILNEKITSAQSAKVPEYAKQKELRKKIREAQQNLRDSIEKIRKLDSEISSDQAKIYSIIQ